MKEILNELINNGLSIHSISKNTGKSYSTIRYWLKKYNLSTDFKSFREIDKKEIGEYKYCPMCEKNSKIIEEFYKRSDNRGYSTYCKKCSNKKSLDRLKNIRKINRIDNPLTSKDISKKISDGLNKILSLNPVSYNKRMEISSLDYNHKEVGFIAQEVQKILPDLVYEGKDEEHLLSLNYNGIVAYLTKAIHEQQEIINKQQTTLSVQKNRINQHENTLKILISRIEALEKNR